ncbi:carbohydrate porin [Bryocella elongata]|uniref:carbohydrate porin n=1 Tax=Bryocella elongata TaxID=863522 RepID=UPI001F233289|nr:carbohydrate porin [Bryocella elongata]
MDSCTSHQPAAENIRTGTVRAFAAFAVKAVLLTASALAQASAAAQQPQIPDAPEPAQHRVQSGQALDWDAAVLARVPPDPLFHHDPLSPVLAPLDAQLTRLHEAEKLSFSATYTLLNQYATATPAGVRHDWGTGRFDLNGGWKAWDHGGSAGSFSLLVRSGTNLGVSEQFNLSDRIGSALYLNCLPGGGAQQPISLNVLYYRQDFWQKKMAFYIGKIHPNEFVSLSMYNNDERTQFLNGENDGNLTISSDGAYAGGAALEYQATEHFFVHAVTVDTEGSQQTGIKTLADRKYMNAIEVEWKEGAPTQQNHVFRASLWRDDTAKRGSGHGVGFAEDWEFASGWVAFSRLGLATDKGTSIRRVISLGGANIRPFGRRGDMFGAAVDLTEPSYGAGGLHHEALFETFYRARLTKSFELGPDLEVDVHPTYARKEYTTALIGARARIIF